MVKIENIQYTPIGIIHSSFHVNENMPIQPISENSGEGYIELFPEFLPCLKDIEGFSHLILIYHLHKVKGYDLLVKPFMENEFHGIFATRAPARPNPIGLSTVRLLRIDDNQLYVENLDVLDGTPLLDIKPFLRQFDKRENAISGWLENKSDVRKYTADNRFSK
jgi:tRNA-Thr(GGU) m(6)t(6)A37 methyltransferase TsaA